MADTLTAATSRPVATWPERVEHVGPPRLVDVVLERPGRRRAHLVGHPGAGQHGAVAVGRHRLHRRGADVDPDRDRVADDPDLTRVSAYALPIVRPWGTHVDAADRHRVRALVRHPVRADVPVAGVRHLGWRNTPAGHAGSGA